MKGMIVDIKGKNAVIIKKDGTFALIRNRNYKIGDKINEINYSRYAVAAACFIISISTSFAGYAFYNVPFSYVYIDAGSSIRLDINYFNRVVGYSTLNDKANTVNISLGNTKKSIESIIDQCISNGLINDNIISVNIMTKNESLSNKIKSVIDKINHNGYNCVVTQSSKEDSKIANDYGISVNRYNIIKEYTELFGGEVSENIKILEGESLSEIESDIKNKQLTEDVLNIIQDEYKINEPETSTNDMFIGDNEIIDIPIKSVDDTNKYVPNIKIPSLIPKIDWSYNGNYNNGTNSSDETSKNQPQSGVFEKKPQEDVKHDKDIDNQESKPQDNVKQDNDTDKQESKPQDNLNHDYNTDKQESKPQDNLNHDNDTDKQESKPQDNVNHGNDTGKQESKPQDNVNHGNDTGKQEGKPQDNINHGNDIRKQENIPRENITKNEKSDSSNDITHGKIDFKHKD